MNASLATSHPPLFPFSHLQILPLPTTLMIYICLSFTLTSQKRWDEALERPPLNYEEFFDTDVGQIPGLTIWEIENFLPNQIDESVYGKFYEGDCYIILQTLLDDSQNLDWKIFFWIGEKSTVSHSIFSKRLDKRYREM